MYRLRRIFNPEIFQGKFKTTKNYFEGWYFKVIDFGQKAPLAVIPGVSFQKDGKDAHAFIQVMDARHGHAHYFRFPLSEFRASNDSFQVWIGDNYFSRDEINLNIETDQGSIKGHLRFDHIVPFPKTLTNPGIMGPYTFIPWMECYHGIVNIHHEIRGNLILDGKEFSYDGGYGYIEKDWGKSFPTAWIWIQSNHFPEEDISLMFSYANIPWMGRSFMGLIAFLRFDGNLYRFATYTKAKIEKMAMLDGRLEVRLSDKKYRLFLDVENGGGETLKAPKNGLMIEKIQESIAGVVRVSLEKINGEILYRGTGTQTGVEISEGMEDLLK